MVVVVNHSPTLLAVKRSTGVAPDETVKTYIYVKYTSKMGCKMKNLESRITSPVII